MTSELVTLSITAMAIALGHTLCGPDHYIPFVAMARAGDWSVRRTLLITIVCGLGHVSSSIALGGIGVAFGIMVANLEAVESVRGNVAGWLLLSFGLAYLVWGILRAIRNTPHEHIHIHADGTMHSHVHTHSPSEALDTTHLHVHTSQSTKTDSKRRRSAGDLRAWSLFVIFVLGPCEPLIPLLMYPAARASLWGIVWVSLLFCVVTIATMTSMVAIMLHGTRLSMFAGIERYGHAMAGLAIFGCGFAMKVGL